MNAGFSFKFFICMFKSPNFHQWHSPSILYKTSLNTKFLHIRSDEGLKLGMLASLSLHARNLTFIHLFQFFIETAAILTYIVLKHDILHPIYIYCNIFFKRIEFKMAAVSKFIRLQNRLIQLTSLWTLLIISNMVLAWWKASDALKNSSILCWKIKKREENKQARKTDANLPYSFLWRISSSSVINMRISCFIFVSQQHAQVKRCAVKQEQKAKVVRLSPALRNKFWGRWGPSRIWT